MIVPERLVVPLLTAMRRNRIWIDADAARYHLRERSLRPVRYAPPARLGSDVELSVERVDSWPVFSLRPRDTEPTGTVIYAHGGGWVNEIVVQHWRLCAEIAAEAATTVQVPIYPLIPFGDAASTVDGFTALARAASTRGPLCLAGDSAGGQIALSTTLALRDENTPVPRHTILISPGLDGRLANPAIPAVEAIDPWLGRAGVRVFVDVWRGDLPVEDPRVSPLFGDFTGLGPISIYTGTRDILNPDARELAVRARAAGVRVDLEEQPGCVHVYPLLPTPSGVAARGRIVAEIRAAVHAGSVSGKETDPQRRFPSQRSDESAR